MFDVIGLMILAEGEPKPHSRESQSVCGAPVARFGVWVGPLALDRHKYSWLLTLFLDL
jgi:hypothetical protein